MVQHTFLVSVEHWVPTIRDPFVDAGWWVGEIQLASYGFMVRNWISHTNIADKIWVARRYQDIQSVTQLMSRVTDTLNQTATLKDVVKPGPITTLTIQMDIYIDTNDETGTSRRQKARKSQKIFQKLSSTWTRRTVHTSSNKAIVVRLERKYDNFKWPENWWRDNTGRKCFSTQKTNSTSPTSTPWFLDEIVISQCKRTQAVSIIWSNMSLT